jgi:chromosome partitioning protein
MLNIPERELVLKKALEPLKDQFDYIIIDCSPSLGIITINSLSAADSVLIPVQCEYFALEGLGKLLNTIKLVQNRLNTSLKIEGFLLTMFDSRTRHSNLVVDEVRNHFNEMVFKTVIQRNVRLTEAPSHGKPVILHDALSAGTNNYLNLAREILKNNSQ